jgi:hypothetical protein
MNNFVVNLDQGRKVQIRLFGLKRTTPCTYPKKDKLKQRKIENSIEASIIVIGYVNPTKNLQELS